MLRPAVDVLERYWGMSNFRVDSCGTALVPALNYARGLSAAMLKMMKKAASSPICIDCNKT
jgi:hypothetical protein